MRPKTALTPITITAYQRRYLGVIRDLLFHSKSVHTHLDWNETDQWLDTQDVPMRLAWQGGRLVGVLATSKPLNDTCWIRLAAVPDRADQKGILSALWNDLVFELRGVGVQQVALLGVHEWITSYMPMLGFHYVEDIVTLARSGRQIPEPRPTQLTIRAAETTDLDTLVHVDQSAFGPPWQLAKDELRQAYRISASCTVALLGDRIVGYQLSTLYFDGSHLARLAVLPAFQGNGAGGMLLGDVIQRFLRRGVFSMTVNTQASNLQSQRLYHQFGFRPNGYDLPFWSTEF